MLLPRRIRKTRLGRHAILTRQYLTQTGWERSLKEAACVDIEGNPLPWYTYPAIDFLAERVTQTMRVFEYGCGNSTRWWAAHAVAVSAVESSREWIDRVAPQLPPWARVSYQPLGDDAGYARAILDETDPLDIVVIDGIDRVNCARHAHTKMTSTGVVVWDNSDRRDEYADGFRTLQDLGFRELRFSGMGPLNSYGWSTSIFYRDSNCLNI